jgi:hypothetical protein
VVAVIVGPRRLRYCVKAAIIQFLHSRMNIKVLLRTLARGGGIINIIHARKLTHPQLRKETT